VLTGQLGFRDDRGQIGDLAADVALEPVADYAPVHGAQVWCRVAGGAGDQQVAMAAVGAGEQRGGADGRVGRAEGGCDHGGHPLAMVHARFGLVEVVPLAAGCELCDGQHICQAAERPLRAKQCAQPRRHIARSNPAALRGGSRRDARGSLPAEHSGRVHVHLSHRG
jgi:hypothetical protein